jgi:hypothetical protein
MAGRGLLAVTGTLETPASSFPEEGIAQGPLLLYLPNINKGGKLAINSKKVIYNRYAKSGI